jgi:acid phosphatase type 7
VIAAAGDIACDPASSAFNAGRGSSSRKECMAGSVAELLAAHHVTAVLPLGDLQYECGRISAFDRSYALSWGRFNAIAHPVPGNHEYGHTCGLDDPQPYFAYFKGHVGSVRHGYYSYDIGSWHLIALDSECLYRGAPAWHNSGWCGAGSSEEHWLRNDLARDRALCTLAYWHKPRFSSGVHGDNQQMSAIWNDLVAAHVDVVLSGHNHDYERFAPLGTTVHEHRRPGIDPTYQDPTLDPTGIREFVVGTGGRSLDRFPHPPLRGELVRNNTTFGALFLTLRPKGYDWQFLPVTGGSFTDSGSATCH